MCFKGIPLGRWVVVVLGTRERVPEVVFRHRLSSGFGHLSLTAARDAGPLPLLPHFEKHSLVGQRMRQTEHTTTPEFVANMALAMTHVHSPLFSFDILPDTAIQMDLSPDQLA